MVALTKEHIPFQISLPIFFVLEKVLNNSLIVTHIPVADQVAHTLTKPLSQTRFSILRHKLNEFEGVVTVYTLWFSESFL